MAESKSLKAQALIAMLAAVSGWIAMYVGYSLKDFPALLIGGMLFILGTIWCLTAIVIGYVKQHLS